jgi:DNA-binding transcriptional regulator YiaG
MSTSDELPERELTSEELADAHRYTLIIEWSPEDEAFIVSVPDIPGIHTHGATREEAAFAGDQVLALWLSARRRASRSVPSPTFTARYATDALPTTSDAERIRQIRHQLNVSQREFAEMLNVSLGTVRSWEQGQRTPDGASLRLLDIAERQPDVLANVSPLKRERSALSA